jgi:hypothetical protein
MRSLSIGQHPLLCFVQPRLHLPLTAYCQIYIRTSCSFQNINPEDGNCNVFKKGKTFNTLHSLIPKAEVIHYFDGLDIVINPPTLL